MPLIQRSLLNKGIIAILLITFIWAIGDSSFEFAYPTYLQENELPTWVIGIIISLGGAVALFLDIPTGSLTNTTSIKRIIILGLLAQSVAALIFFMTTENFLLGAMIILWGSAFSIFYIGRDVFYAIVTKQKTRSQQYGMLNSVEILAFAIGPILGGLILGSGGYLPISFFYIATTVVCCFLALYLIREIKKMKIQGSLRILIKRRKLVVGAIKNFSRYGFQGISMMFYAFLINIFYSIVLILVPLFYAVEGGLTELEGGTLISVFFVPFIIFSYFFGKLEDKFGKRRFIALGLFIAFLGLLFFSYSNGFLELAASAFIASTGIAMTVPAVSGMVINMIGKGKKGDVVGIWDFTLDVAWTVGPLLIGFLGEFFGLHQTFLIFGIMMLISIVLLVKVKSK